MIPKESGLVRARQWVRARLARWRVVALWFLRAALVGALVAAAAVGADRVRTFVRESPTFALETIEVVGLDRLAQGDVLDAAGVAPGLNVFARSEAEIRDRLLAQPWIAEATVARRLPDRLSISIREHRAAAVLVLDGLYLVADDSSVFKPLEPGDPSDLPVITGVDPEAFTNDRATRTRVLVSAVALLHDYRDAGLWRREPLAEIHVEPGGALSLYVGQEATYVRLGQRPYRKKLRRFRKVLDSLRKQKAEAEYVYLDNQRRPDRVTVRLR